MPHKPQRNRGAWRKRERLLVTLALLTPMWAGAGTITGTVRAQGKEGTGQDITGGVYESRKFKFAERVNYAELRDFAVYIDEASSDTELPRAKHLQVTPIEK